MSRAPLDLRRFPSIPEPQPSTESLIIVSRALKEAVETLTGQRVRGNMGSAAVTWDDLKAYGIEFTSMASAKLAGSAGGLTGVDRTPDGGPSSGGSGSPGDTGPVGPTGPPGATGSAGPGLPAAGYVGQFLKKASTSIDYATAWATLLVTDVSSLPAFLDARVLGPTVASSVNDAPVLWDGASGRIIKETTYAAFKTSLAITTGDVSGLSAALALKLDASVYTAADVLTKLLTVDGVGSSLDADLLDGLDSAAFQLASGYTAADVLAKLLTVDGSGSGIDADFLDGLSSAAFQLASGYTAADVLAKLLTVDGFGSGIDADFLDGFSSAAFQLASGYTAADVLAKLLTVDGAGSGIDADLLDGLSSAAFQLASGYTAADVLAKLLTVDGAGSGIDADLLDGLSSAAFQLASGYTAADVLAKLLTVDGAGSGIDADLLDGLSSAAFQLASGYTAADVLAKLITVDGAGSLLDADFLDGNSSAFYQDAANLTGTLAAARVADNSLPPAKQMFAATSRVLGRITAGAGAGEELTGANVATIIGYTAADVLAKLLTVDGPGSQIDADLLDGASSAAYALIAGPVFTGPVEISNNAPAYYWTELDQADPVGRWRMLGSGGGIFLQRATIAGGFTSAESSFSINSSGIASFLNTPQVAGADIPLKSTANTWALAQTFVGDLILTTTASLVRTDTVDGSDNKNIIFCSSDAAGATRGAYLSVYGNDHASFPGRLNLVSGDNSTLMQIIGGMGTAAQIIIRNAVKTIGSDDGSITISSGYASTAAVTRGAYVQMFGINHATSPGDFSIFSGNGGSIKLNSMPISSQAIATDAAFTLTPGTSPMYTKHTGTLTAARALTLSTTGAILGMRFRVTRTGGGAFNITHALKNLATNQWADFVYDGAAWYLSAFGSL